MQYSLSLTIEHAYILIGANKKDFLMMDVSDIPICIKKMFSDRLFQCCGICVVNLCIYVTRDCHYKTRLSVRLSGYRINFVKKSKFMFELYE
jgi:hypothetical protein